MKRSHSDYGTGGRPKSVAVTFDDGCESDLIIAAPILKEAGCNATFYATVSYLGQRGYMSAIELRELSAFGFEIGCHSMTHAYLTDLDDHGLQRETGEAKTQLEEILESRWNTSLAPAAVVTRA